MATSPPPARGLLGRSRECDALDEVLTTVRAGRSRVLVVRGEAGVGKSVLLDYLVERAAGCRITRASGVESEMELAYSGLHQLCAPLLDRSEGLPPAQRDALGAALGRSTGDAPERFLVGLAVLSLLSEVAEEQPLVCVIDDVQWLDRASAQTLAFVARRLLAEPVGMVFAAREPTDGLDVAGLPDVEVGGLSDGDARTLLNSAIRGRLDERLRDRIVAEARGNPLALLELPRGLTPAELAGGFGLPDVVPVTSRIELSFTRQLDALPRQSRELLLAAAAEPLGDAALLWRAADRLGLPPESAVPASAAGFVEIGLDVRFRHPLMRSAAYRAASVADRQRVHDALADATDPETDPDRRAWHRAHAAGAPDESLARELERSAGRAQARGGVAAAAAFLARAAELTPDASRRGARALAAAQAKHDAGAPESASELLAIARLGPLDEHSRARTEHLRARIAFSRKRGGDAPRLLLGAARRLGPVDPQCARETYLEAMVAAMWAGRLGDRPGVEEVAAAARGAPPGARPLRAIDLLLDGLAVRFTEGYAAGVRPLREALHAFRDGIDPSQEDIRWLWLATRLAQDLWDDGLWHDLAARSIEVAQENGLLSLLAMSYAYQAALRLHEGRFDDAITLIAESDALVAATGMAPVYYAASMLRAWRGTAKDLEAIEASGRDASSRGEGMGVGGLYWVRALIHNSRGRPDEALATAREGCQHDDVGVHAWLLVELIEAAARAGTPNAAVRELDQLAERTSASGTDWALGIEAGSRALLAEGPTAEALHREAVDRLSRTRIALHLARAQLHFGEWLRRENRRIDAREQLRAAHETFSASGAEPFAERARRELLATGETVRRRVADTRDALTPQEAQVARLARDGGTNAEIGARLFISPRTVEYHLHKVFAKLGIRSRRELREVLATT